MRDLSHCHSYTTSYIYEIFSEFTVIVNYTSVTLMVPITVTTNNCTSDSFHTARSQTVQKSTIKCTLTFKFRILNLSVETK